MSNESYLKELSSFDKTMLKDIYNSIGIDYNKPFKIVKLTKSFTLNSLKEYCNPTDDVYCLIKRNTQYCRNFYLCKVVPYNNIVSTNTIGHGYAISSIYYKKTFEELRKENTLTYLFIVDKNVHNDKKRVVNDKYVEFQAKNILLNRYKSKESLANAVITGSCVPVWRIFGKEYDRQETMGKSVLDKSGYCKAHKQDELKRQARRVREQREEEKLGAYLKSDEYKNLVDTILNKCNSIRNQLVILLTTMDYKELDSTVHRTIVNTLHMLSSTSESVSNDRRWFVNLGSAQNSINRQLKEIMQLERQVSAITIGTSRNLVSML